MRNHLFQILSLLIFTAFTLQAQPGEKPAMTGKITGKVVDVQTGAPLCYATVSLFLQKDSSLVTGAITEDNGAFLLEVKQGSYFIKFEFLAFQSKTVSNITVSRDNPDVDMGIVKMEAEATLLNEVVVQAEKSTMQLALDKKIFNVGKDLSNAGGSAVDILDNIPSVQVDVEGNVSLRGSGNVRILIDGKPSGLMSFNGSGGLRQLPANLIDKVEVITNPSARYEAEGMSGIINIVLKKERRNGMNGSFDLTAGTPDNYGVSFNLNYRRDKLNLFSNYGVSYQKNPGYSKLYQEVYDGDTTYITDQVGNRERGGLSNNIRFGADYFFNDKNILTSSFSYRYGKDKNFSDLIYRDYIFNTDNPTGITTRRDEETETDPNQEYSLNYKKLFGREGHELVADVRFQDNTETEKSDLVNKTFNGDFTPTGEPDLLQRSTNKEGENLIIAQLDYIKPFNKDGKFEVGTRNSFRKITNDYLVEEFNDDVWQPLDGLNNNFQYQEDIYAAYASYGNKINKFSFLLGLRAEHSEVKTELLQTNEVNDRSYTNFFPTAHFTYDLINNNAVQLSYSRRLRRPRFWDLNPFFTFSDNRNFFSGNPGLDPEFTHSLEAGHIKYFDKGSFSSSVYYRHTDGKIERIRTVDSLGNSNTRPQNLATEDAYGFEFTASYALAKWWKLDGNVNFFHSETDGSNLGESFRSETYSWFTRLTSKFTPWKGTDIQLRGNYEAPQVTTQGKRKASYVLDLAASQDILKNTATLTLNVRDLLNTRRHRYITEGNNFYTEGDFQWRGRQLNLTLNYRLNQKKQRAGGREGGGEGGDGMDF